MARLLSQYSLPVTPGNFECDIDRDGQIGTADLIPLLGNFANGCDWAEYAYDWADRLVEVRLSSFENGSAATGGPPRVEVHRYEYDALGRRIARTLFASGSVGSGVPQARCTRFIHGGVGTAADAVVGWQVLEEQDGAGETLATFVPSGRSGAVDEVVCFERDLIGSGLIENLGMAPTEPVCGPPAPAAEDPREYWLHRDDQFSTTSVTDAQGQVVERYDYHDYGFPLILDHAGEPLGLNAQSLYASRVGNASLFTGREWDGESKLYHYRTRAYHPGLGRFMQIDRIGVWGDPFALGSSYAYCSSSPLVWIDGFGYMPEWMADAIVAITGSGATANSLWDTTSNFSAGYADSLSFGITEGIRSGIFPWDDIVDYESDAYFAGEMTQVAVDIATLGTSTALKVAAKGVTGKSAREQAKELIKSFRKEEGVYRDITQHAHHKYPLAEGPFPTCGLRPWIHSARWNLEILDRASHIRRHRYLRRVYNVFDLLFPRWLVPFRPFRDYFSPPVIPRPPDDLYTPEPPDELYDPCGR